jgi:uncharacterized membrane-anchored protein
VLVLLVVLAGTAPSFGAPPEPQVAEDEYLAELRAFEDSLQFVTGTVELPSGKATLALPGGYRYLGSAETDRVLQFWGNPPDPDTEGMIVPPGPGPVEEGGWAVVITYADDGHVDDSDAATIDYDEILASMRGDIVEENAERERLQLETFELIGWAEPPHYDRATHKLYWAKALQFSDTEGRTLNYAVRVLGREGVLELNAVAQADQIEVVTPEMARMLAFSEFTAGNRYADYRPGKDRSSGYGIAAVVAGTAFAAKAAGSKGFVAVLLAAKKLLLVIAVAIAGFFKAMWSRIRRLFGKTDDV